MNVATVSERRRVLDSFVQGALNRGQDHCVLHGRNAPRVTFDIVDGHVDGASGGEAVHGHNEIRDLARAMNQGDGGVNVFTPSQQALNACAVVAAKALALSGREGVAHRLTAETAVDSLDVLHVLAFQQLKRTPCLTTDDHVIVYCTSKGAKEADLHGLFGVITDKTECGHLVRPLGVARTAGGRGSIHLTKDPALVAEGGAVEVPSLLLKVPDSRDFVNDSDGLVEAFQVEDVFRHGAEVVEAASFFQPGLLPAEDVDVLSHDQGLTKAASLYESVCYSGVSAVRTYVASTLRSDDGPESQGRNHWVAISIYITAGPPQTSGEPASSTASVPSTDFGAATEPGAPCNGTVGAMGAAPPTGGLSTAAKEGEGGDSAAPHATVQRTHTARREDGVVTAVATVRCSGCVGSNLSRGGRGGGGDSDTATADATAADKGPPETTYATSAALSGEARALAGEAKMRSEVGEEEPAVGQRREQHWRHAEKVDLLRGAGLLSPTRFPLPGTVALLFARHMKCRVEPPPPCPAMDVGSPPPLPGVDVRGHRAQAATANAVDQWRAVGPNGTISGGETTVAATSHSGAAPDGRASGDVPDMTRTAATAATVSLVAPRDGDAAADGAVSARAATEAEDRSAVNKERQEVMQQRRQRQQKEGLRRETEQRQHLGFVVREDADTQISRKRPFPGATGDAAAAPAPPPPSVRGLPSLSEAKTQCGAAAVPRPHARTDCAVQQQHTGEDALASAAAGPGASRNDTVETTGAALPTGGLSIAAAEEEGGDYATPHATVQEEGAVTAVAAVPCSGCANSDSAQGGGGEGGDSDTVAADATAADTGSPEMTSATGAALSGDARAQVSLQRLSAGAANGAAGAPTPPPPTAKGLPSLGGDEAQRGAAAVPLPHVNPVYTVQQRHAGGAALTAAMAISRVSGTHDGAAPDGTANDDDPDTTGPSAAAATVSIGALRYGDVAPGDACSVRAETEAVGRRAESEKSQEARALQRQGRQQEEGRQESEPTLSEGGEAREGADAQLSLRRLSAGAAGNAAGALAPPLPTVNGLPSLGEDEAQRGATAVPLPHVNTDYAVQQQHAGNACVRRNDGFALSAGASLDDSDATAAAPDTTPLRAEPTVKGGGAVTPESDDVTAAPSIPGLARGKRDCVGVPTPSGDTPACKRLTRSATTLSPAPSAPLPSYTLQDVPGMRVPELKAELTRRNLSADGLKSALVARLAQAMAAPDSR